LNEDLCQNDRHMGFLLAARRKCPPVLASLGLALAEGCRRAPSVGIYGSYFPGWLICLAIAIVLTLFIRSLLRRYDFEERLHPLGLVYVCLATTLTCLLWLVFFF
jgi:YtcA family